MPSIFTLKNALLTFENLIVYCEHNPITAFNKLQEYEIEIGYDLDNKPIKLWIHDSKTGMTILRIQEKPGFTPSTPSKPIKPKNGGQSQGTTFQ